MALYGLAYGIGLGAAKTATCPSTGAADPVGVSLIEQEP